MDREIKTIKIYKKDWEKLTRKKAQTGRSYADYIEELQKMVNGGDEQAKKILKRNK